RRQVRRRRRCGRSLREIPGGAGSGASDRRQGHAARMNARRAPMTIRAALAAAVLLATSGGAGAAGLKVRVATAMKAAMDQLAAAFEQATPHKVVVGYGPSGALAKRIAAGEAADLVVFAGGVDELIAQGKIVPAGRTDIARAKIGVAVRRGAPKPDVATTE